MSRSHTISKADANTEIRKFLEIKEEYDPQNQSQLSQSANNFMTSTLVSFAFYKDQLDSLFNSVQDANGFRIYFGADSSGAPTLVVFPCTITEGESSYSASNKISTAGEGEQYPFTFTTSYNKTNFDVEDE